MNFMWFKDTVLPRFVDLSEKSLDLDHSVNDEIPTAAYAR